MRMWSPGVHFFEEVVVEGGGFSRKKPVEKREVGYIREESVDGEELLEELGRGFEGTVLNPVVSIHRRSSIARDPPQGRSSSLLSVDRVPEHHTFVVVGEDYIVTRCREVLQVAGVEGVLDGCGEPFWTRKKVGSSFWLVLRS